MSTSTPAHTRAQHSTILGVVEQSTEIINSVFRQTDELVIIHQRKTKMHKRINILLHIDEIQEVDGIESQTGYERLWIDGFSNAILFEDSKSIMSSK